MQAQLIAWLLSFAAALGKRIATEAEPVALGLVFDLTETIYDLTGDLLDAALTPTDKTELRGDAINVAKTAWAVAKQEGLLLASDSALLLAQAAGSEIQSALGL